MTYLDRAPAGIVSATSPTTDRTVELISMWVDPFARGNGVGDALVGAVVEWARSSGARRVTLDVTEQNLHAIALYRRHGFAQTHVLEGELRMELRLR